MQRRDDGRWATAMFGFPVVEERGGRSRWFVEPTPGSERLGPFVDPDASHLWFGPDHERHRPDIWAVCRPWPSPRAQRWTSRDLVVYEAHVRGMTMRHDRSDRGTFAALLDELPRLADLGVSVLELLPVHQFDPAEHNYWGYMPIVFGAVHQQYADDPDRAPDELAALVATAHDLDIEVWLDVVFNHTSEEDENGPLHHLRLLGRRPVDGEGRHGHDAYVMDPTDGSLADEAGTGNTIDAFAPLAL
ncbi:MAG: alpha-amylase family glycosyl hydrolase [Actinomycetota bacterium]